MASDFGAAVEPAEPKKTKPWVTIVIIIAVVLVLLCCCVLFVIFGLPALLALLGPNIGNVFSGISENLMTP